ncbi:MAG TPA: TraR/DksA C4-type zinc finger protein [Anaerolineae bacterium]
MVENLDLDTVRQTLETERSRLLQRLSDHGGRTESRNPDRTYLAQNYASRERDTALLAMEREQLTQIEQALTRLDAGTYGTCVSCGEAIAPGRLEVLPYAVLCIGCQAQHR